MFLKLSYLVSCISKNLDVLPTTSHKREGHNWLCFLQKRYWWHWDMPRAMLSLVTKVSTVVSPSIGWVGTGVISREKGCMLLHSSWAAAACGLSLHWSSDWQREGMNEAQQLWSSWPVAVYNPSLCWSAWSLVRQLQPKNSRVLGLHAPLLPADQVIGSERGHGRGASPVSELDYICVSLAVRVPPV